MDQKLDFSDDVPHKFFIYGLIAPELHQKVCIDIILVHDKENHRSRSKLKVKWAKNAVFQTVYRTTFSFKLHWKACIDTSLAQEEKNQ